MVTPKTVFLDTNYFCGLNNPKDTLYLISREAFKKLRKEKHNLFISNFVIAEVLTVLSQKVGKKASIKFGKDIFGLKSPIKILRVDKEIELKSFKIFKKIKSKNVSFVDASIIALMKKYKIDYLLTFDKKLLRIAKTFGIKGL